MAKFPPFVNLNSFIAYFTMCENMDGGMLLEISEGGLLFVRSQRNYCPDPSVYRVNMPTAWCSSLLYAFKDIQRFGKFLTTQTRLLCLNTLFQTLFRRGRCFPCHKSKTLPEELIK